MTLKTIAIRNILRRKGKMALVVFGLALAVATLVAVVSLIGAFQGTVDRRLDDYGFNIVAYPKSKQMLIEYGNMVVGSLKSYEAPALSEKDLAALREAGKERIKVLSPKLLEAVEIGDKRVLVAGVDLKQERRVKTWWLVDAGAYPANTDEVFVGVNVAKKLGLELGDGVKIFDRDLKVAGILMETGSQDDDLIFADLEALRRMTGRPGQTSLVEVAAKTSEDVEPLVRLFNGRLPRVEVQSVKQAVSYKENVLGHLYKFGLGITGVVTAISALIVFIMMASSVNERRTEIGIFRAVGFRQRHVATIILTEALILGCVGGLAGYLFGFGLAQGLPWVSREITVVVRPDIRLVFAAVAMAATIGFLASLVPAYRAARLDPIESLKSI